MGEFIEKPTTDSPLKSQFKLTHFQNTDRSELIIGSRSIRKVLSYGILWIQILGGSIFIQIINSI